MRSFIVPALLCIALSACAPPPPDPRGVAKNEVLLQVVAIGRTDTRPDQARFTAGVQTIAPTAAAASTGNNAVMTRVTTALEALGVKRDDIQTRQLTLQRINYGPQRGRFQADNLVEIRVRAIDRAGEAIAAATEAGANVVSGPDLVISDPEAASRSAYAAAYKAARARADTYAQAAGLKVDRVLTIRDAGADDGPYAFIGDGMGREAVAQSVAPPVRPGMSTSEVRVRADFALRK